MAKGQFNRFYKYDEIVGWLRRIAKAYPDLVGLEVIGQSHLGRDIFVVTVTDNVTQSAAKKPALWLDGNLHAMELISSTACLFFIDKLVNGYECDEKITRILRKFTFYICPRLDPDGAEAALGASPKFVRSSLRPYPYDEDPIEGVVSRDIDGDGRLLLMRFLDSNGNWKKHPDEPRLMIRREPGEEGGEYYTLLNEGDLYHLKGDIYRHARPKESLDLNRNFPNWAPEAEQSGAGDAPLSEPETRAMTDFIVSHKNITVAVYGHSFAGVLLRPSASVADSELPTSDLRLYKMMGEKGRSLTGYPDLSVFHDYRYDQKSVIKGTQNWFYEALGIICWTVEYWAPHIQAGVTVNDYIEWFNEHPVEDDLKMLQWSDRVLDGQGYIDWYEFDHPVLGPVELGGWNILQPIYNPPDHLIEKEIAPVMDWVLWLATLLPCIELYRAQVKHLGEDLYYLEFVVENTGYMPTYGTVKAADGGVSREVMAEIQMPDDSHLVQGKPRENLGHLSGRNRVPATSFANDTVAVVGGNTQRAIVEWIVKAPRGTEITLIAHQSRSGFVRATVICEQDLQTT